MSSIASMQAQIARLREQIKELREKQDELTEKIEAVEAAYESFKNVNGNESFKYIADGLDTYWQILDNTTYYLTSDGNAMTVRGQVWSGLMGVNECFSEESSIAINVKGAIEDANAKIQEYETNIGQLEQAIASLEAAIAAERARLAAEAND